MNKGEGVGPMMLKVSIVLKSSYGLDGRHRYQLSAMVIIIKGIDCYYVGEGGGGCTDSGLLLDTVLVREEALFVVPGVKMGVRRPVALLPLVRRYHHTERQLLSWQLSSMACCSSTTAMAFG